MSGPAVLSVLAVLTAPSPAKSLQEFLELRLDYRIGAEQDPDWTLGPVGDAPSGLEFEDELRRNGLIPQYLPPFAGLFVGQDGSIWVRREAERAGVVDYTLLDEDGGSRGTVRLPREQQVIAARGSIFATAEETSLGVPVLRRYGIAP